MKRSIPTRNGGVLLAVVLVLLGVPCSKGSLAAQEQPARIPVASDVYDAVTSGEISVSLTFLGANSDLSGPQESPFDAQLTLKKEFGKRSAMRIVMKPGTVIDGSGNSVVLLDEVTVELPPDHLAEKTIPVKAYRQRFPARVYDMGKDFNRPKEGYKYVYTIPDLRGASDPVRQAAVWIAKDRVTYGKYTKYYGTEYSDGSGGTVTRTDPFQISQAQWTEAQRIIKIITPERQRELDAESAESAERARQGAESARLRAEAKAEAKSRAEQAKLIKADREARTIKVTLQQAVADGLVTISLDALAPPPATIELRIEPTPALGTTILDLMVPAGTVVREASGGEGAKTGYLSPGTAQIERPDPVTLQLTCLLRSLDDAGPGDFVVGWPDPITTLMMPRAGFIRVLHVLASVGSDEYAQQAIYAQMIILAHGDKAKTLQQWKDAFKSKGLDDPYASIKTMFDETTTSRDSKQPVYEQGLSHRGIHRTIQSTVFWFEHQAKNITAPDGSTYPEAHVIGTWRMAKGRSAVDLHVQLQARARELVAILKQQRETPDLADIEKAVLGVYERSIPAVHKLWQQGSPNSVIGRIEARQKLRYDLQLKPDHTFDVILDTRIGDVSGYTKFERDPAYERSESGTWTWNGRNVGLSGLARGPNPRRPGAQGQFTLELSKGMLLVPHPKSSTGKRSGQAVLTKGPTARTRPSSGPKDTPPSIEATPDTKPRSDKPEKPKATATHMLTMHDGRIILGRLVSMDEQEVRFVVMRSGIAAEIAYKRDEVASVKEIEPKDEPTGLSRSRAGS